MQVTKRCDIYSKTDQLLKKSVARSMTKVVKSKVVAQNWLWWSDNGKISEFGANSEATQIRLNCCY